MKAFEHMQDNHEITKNSFAASGIIDAINYRYKISFRDIDFSS